MNDIFTVKHKKGITVYPSPERTKSYINYEDLKGASIMNKEIMPIIIMRRANKIYKYQLSREIYF